MRQRRFEEVLDECISAYLEGRRSVEDSLSLYPSEARRLEPLLRAAADTFDLFQELRPPAQSQERIRQRIVRAAAERAAARALTREINGFGVRAARPLFGWTVLGSAVAGMAALLIVAGALLPGVLSSDDDGPGARTETVATEQTPALNSSILNARHNLEAIQQKASAGRDIGLRDLNALTGATRTLAEAAESEGLAAEEADALEAIIQEQLSLLSRLGVRSSAAEKEQIETVRVLTFQLAESLGLNEASPSVAATPSPTAPAGTPTAEPTQSPTPTPAPTPEPQPTASPLP
jgi:hypothetical protein